MEWIGKGIIFGIGRFKSLQVHPATANAMASSMTFLEKWTLYYHPHLLQFFSKSSPSPNQLQTPSVSVSRRSTATFLLSSLPLSFVWPAQARERRNRKTVPIEDYQNSPEGLKYYDLIEGKGPIVEKGATVLVHFDCIYRGITAVSSRESKLLAGNRIIAQPYEFTVGSPPGKERKREYVDNPNGLFSAQAAPKPPPAMYSVTEGMRVGGKRTVIVPPEYGYGQKGMNEIPAGATFELNIELLQVVSPEQ